ncbi:hypothetical protein IWX90DRAFT_455978 [Phyllosticta citrichinensis]|uniref:Dihydrolipoyl dehydrogenase n=1 Tax=Phyllosticta citrichinensis TaxID=1130410 RepID=A0ABR1XPP9_9PEZI
MPPRNHGGPKLPRELLDRIGASAPSDRNGRSRNAVTSRKDRRKAERVQKRAVHRPQSRGPRFSRPAAEESQSEDEDDSPPPPPPKSKPAARDAEQKTPKPILKQPETTAKSETKKAGKEKEPGKDSRKEKKQRDASPPATKKVSKRLQERLDEDDAEIKALEKKLGMKGKKMPKAFEDDGLADLLDGIDDELDFAVSGKRKRTAEDDEWLKSKRRKAGGTLTREESVSDTGSDEEGWKDDELEDGLDDEGLEDSEEEDDIEGDGEEGDFSGLSGDEDEADEVDEDLEDEEMDDDDGSEDMDDEESEEIQQPKVRENPYLPPVSAEAKPTGKYIPPSMRGPPTSDAELMTRLRRQTQGLLNRLSEANLITILKDVEQLYSNNPRQYVTSTLIDILLGLICDRTTLQDTFLILHAGFIAAVYKVVGMDFGAQLVERFVSEFDKQYSSFNEETSGKETTNLMSLMAELYNFQAIGSNLVFDYIRLFLEELKEINTELLLRLVRLSGPQLRQDDPSALKDIVIRLQKAVAKAGESNLSVRSKFMVETINNLKNNRMKTGVAASAITSEHTTRMKKTLGSLNNRNIKASEPLRIGLKDIMDTEKKGKWWLVGASWRNETEENAVEDKTPQEKQKTAKVEPEEIIESGTTDLMQLAKESRMNTDIRRAIFMSIMSASDYKDAHLRLTKLRLKKSQELEIPKVLIHCAGAEQSYNPYYTLIARRLCSEKQLKKAFQFSLWDLFKRMGENEDGDDMDVDDEDGEEALTTRKIVNLGKMFGTLVAESGQPITVLKTLNFAYLRPKTKAFVEVLLSTVILRSQKKASGGRDEKALLDIVMVTKDAPQMARGLQYFFKKKVSRAEAGASKAEQETIRWGARAAFCRVRTDSRSRPDAPRGTRFRPYRSCPSAVTPVFDSLFLPHLFHPSSPAMFKHLIPKTTTRSFARPLAAPRSAFRHTSSTFYLVDRSKRGYATEAPEKDLVIIGGGVAGYVAAIKAGQAGLSVACIEKRGSLGGTCLNVGCIPSKSLLNNSHLYHQILHDSKHRGIEVGEVKLNLEQMMKAKDQSVSGLTKGIEFLFKKNNVEYIKGTGAFQDEHTVKVNLLEGGETAVRGKNIIIATGSEATPFPGMTIDEEKVITSTGAIALKQVPNKMVVIGGGIIGLEMASVWSRLGADVTVVEFLGQIGGPGMDVEISKATEKILKKQGIKFKTGTKVSSGEVHSAGVKVAVEAAKGGKEETLDADVVLVAIGRRPYTQGLGIENVGIETDDRGRLVIDHEYRTKLPHVRVIGDCTFGPMLAHKAEEEAVAAIEYITKNYGHVNYGVIPSVMYTHPEVAWVGQNEAELKQAGINYKVGTFPFSANSRAKTNLDTEGLVKFLADKETDRILGVHIVGPNAGEMIAEAGLAIEYGASSEDVARVCHAHPTLSEAFKEAALNTYDKAIHY